MTFPGDEGWIADLLTAFAATAKLELVLVELFHHEDPAMEGLRAAGVGHGVDTTNGRTYSETVCDGLEIVANKLNELAG